MIKIAPLDALGPVTAGYALIRCAVNVSSMQALVLLVSIMQRPIMENVTVTHHTSICRILIHASFVLKDVILVVHLQHVISAWITFILHLRALASHVTKHVKPAQMIVPLAALHALSVWL